MLEGETLVAKYQVISIDKIDTPEGMPGNDWYCYVIGFGKSKIDGKKPGTLTEVTQHAEAVADDLNSRSKNTKSAYAPKQSQNKNATVAPEKTDKPGSE